MNRPPGETPLSEPEARVLMKLLRHYFPTRVVSIHQPLNCIDYDGPAKKLAEAMAAACPLPVNKLGSRPGSLGSLVGVTLQKPIITFEMPKDAGTFESKLARRCLNWSQTEWPNRPIDGSPLRASHVRPTCRS